MNLKYDKDTLAEIYHNLNTWEWDDRIGEKQTNWDMLHKFKKDFSSPITKKDFISPIMKEIQMKIGHKHCLRWLHINKLGSTRLKFELWWIKRMFRKMFGNL